MHSTAVSTSFLPVMTTTGTWGRSIRTSSSTSRPDRWGIVRSSTITETSASMRRGITRRLSSSVSTGAIPAERRVRSTARSSVTSSSTRSTAPLPSEGRPAPLTEKLPGADPFSMSFLLLRDGRQQDACDRALAGLGLECELPHVLPYDGVGDGEPEPEPPGIELGRKKRLRQAGHRLRRHPRPLVFHADLQVPTGAVHRGGHPDPPRRVRERLEGIDDEVDHHLFQFHGPSPDHRQSRTVVDAEITGPLPDLMVEDADRLPDHLVEIDRAVQPPLLRAGELLEPPD